MESLNFKLVSFAVLIICLCSCHNNNDEQTISEVREMVISSHVPDSLLEKVNVHLFSEYFENPTRSAMELTEVEAKTIMAPLVSAGTQIIDDLFLLSQEGKITFSEEEYCALNNIDDASLAGLAYSVATMEHYKKFDLTMEDGRVKEYKYTKEEIFDCLWFALVGRGGAANATQYIYFTGELMSAATAKQIAMAFFRRTLGWIGVAYAAYQFADCLRTKSNGK